MASAAIILAAGRGSRMGGVDKAALRLPSGETFLERIVRTARLAGVREVVVVRSAEARTPSPEGVTPAFNPRPEDGMLSSLQRGLVALTAPIEPSDFTWREPPPVILLWPVDAPRVPVGVLRLLIEAVEGPVDLAFPSYRGRGGHPAAFSQRLLEEILRAPPTASTRDVLRRPGLVVRAVLVDAPEVLDDFDTPEAYRKLHEQ